MHRSADADPKRAGARVCFDVSNGAFHLNTECASQPALKAVTLRLRPWWDRLPLQGRCPSRWTGADEGQTWAQLHAQSRKDEQLTFEQLHGRGVPLWLKK